MSIRRYLLAWLAFGSVAASSVAADPTSWKSRIADNVSRIERNVAVLDRKAADSTLSVDARLTALDRRVGELEAVRELPQLQLDTRTGDGRLVSLTDSIVALDQRIAVVRSTPVPLRSEQPPSHGRPIGGPVSPTSRAEPQPAPVTPAELPGIRYAEIDRMVFDRDRPGGDRVASWEAMKGKIFDDTGKFISIHDRTAKVAFGDRECKVALAEPLATAIEYGAMVRVRGALDDYWFTPRTVDIVKATLTDMGFRSDAPGGESLGVGDICDATDDILVMKGQAFGATKMEILENLIGIIKKGDRFEIRKSEGIIDAWYYVVSHKDPELRGWASMRLTKAKIVKKS